MQFKNNYLLGALIGISSFLILNHDVGAQFYKGKTVTVVVPAGAGGGLTRSGRLFMKYMSTHIAGTPKMIIKNKSNCKTGG